MRILRYSCQLTPEEVLDRFSRFAAMEKHNPFIPFGEFSNPRIGLHTYVNGNEVNGYYEDGSTTRGGSLQSSKVWFEFTVKPHGEGSFISGLVFSSPYFFLFALIMIGSGIRASMDSFVSGALAFAFAGLFLLLEGLSQKKVTEEIHTLAPKK